MGVCLPLLFQILIAKRNVYSYCLTQFHLLKNIRNNWINQKYPAKTFVLPAPENFNIVENASLSPLKDLYLHELTSYVKLAPELSEKVLHPNNFERQNVRYALQLFNEKYIAGLKEFTENASGMIMFLQQVLPWWNIVNVKTPFKGIAHRQQESNPIYQSSSLDQNLICLKKICEWLDV